MRGFFGGGGSRPEADGAGPGAFWIYVRCAACGETIRVRVSREHDLSAEFEGADFPSAYYTHKEIIGNNCFRRIKVDLYFDGRRQLTEQRIEGGAFITHEEYDAPAGESGGGSADGSSGGTGA